MCMMCSIDPNTTSLLIPVAQAAIISTPILLRDQIRRGAARIGAGRRGADVDADRDGPGPAAERTDRPSKDPTGG